MSNILNKFNTITNNKFVIALMIFFFIVPMGIIDLLSAYLPMTLIRIILCLIVLIKYIPYLIKNKKISPMTIVAIIYCLGRFLITYICSHDLASSLLSYSSFTIIILFMLVDCTVKENTKNLIEGIQIYCEIVIFINFLCLLFPKFGSIFDCDFFLEYDNNHFMYYILGITVSFINHYLNKDKQSKIRMILMCTIVLVTTFSVFSATAIIAFVVLALALFLSFKFNIGNIVSYVIFYFISFVSIIVFNAQHLFSFLIVNILHKDITLSGREKIWNAFKVEILNSPLLGHGYQSDKLFVLNTYLYAHNHILNELYCGGIIMYLVYVWFVILPAKKLLKNKDTNIAKVFSAIILSILVHSLCESLSVVIFTFVYCLMYYIDVYIEKAN